MTNEKEYARVTTQRISDEVRRLRGDRTTQWLADRTAELGYAISRSRISDLERGDRGGFLNVAELLILARALNTAPAMLLFPGLPGQEVELFPEVIVESRMALDWLVGDNSLLRKFAWRKGSEDRETASNPLLRAELLEEWQRNTQAIRLTKEHMRLLFELGRQLEERQRWLDDHDNANAQDLVVAAERFIRSTEQSLRVIRRQMREAGMIPPALPAGMAENYDKDPGEDAE
ncbi:hypothetical protein [Rhodococcus rhodochrous]|uniref:HTH cro/C1-type domain-containing protein n=1 Tax=Rhodococcus rhodochrous TaxID=1829 RepID=A0AA46WRS1_RHORH|nr:hypothetical protein [Rhodococcus rhodochrous]UZF43183.1 hypothetical protein KUM34_014815 [Rhodococcus rhodochrous]